MNSQSTPSGRPGGRRTACGLAAVMGLFGLAPVGAIADQRAAPMTSGSVSVADVSLSDLNLSTPEGMRLARERLRAMAEHLCAARDGGRERSTQPAFGACVDSTMADALRHIAALRHADMTVRSSVTLGATVSLADLDLSTLEGTRIALQRLEAMSRRLCGELDRRQELSHALSPADCVHDALAGALAQADALAAARNLRTARQSAP